MGQLYQQNNTSISANLNVMMLFNGHSHGICLGLHLFAGYTSVISWPGPERDLPEGSGFGPNGMMKFKLPKTNIASKNGDFQ